MAREELITCSSRDGLALAGRMWSPDGPAQAVVALVHGIGDHCGRFAHVARSFTAAGLGVVAVDLRGHGRSAGRRGYISGYESLMMDLDVLLEQAGAYFPESPVFLYGHSMGGNLVLNYALRRRPRLAGVIATSPWLLLVHPPGRPLLLLARVLNSLWPSLALGNGLNVEHMSRDPAVVRAYESDPLIHDRVTAPLFLGAQASGEWALANADQFPVPLLIMHGSADQITSPAASAAFARLAPEATLQIWDGLYHETHNEPEQAEVIGLMVAWLNGRLAA